jgi:uncharacterized protein (TIGR03437 family)
LPARFNDAARLYFLDHNPQVCLGVAVLLLCCAASRAADVPVHPLAVQQTRYELRAGESVPIAVGPETLDFLVKAKSVRLAIDGDIDGDIDGAESSGMVAGPTRAHDRVLLAAPVRVSPGEYTATLSATSATGEKRSARLAIVVKPRLTVPTGATRPPVVLLNGWEVGFTGTCTVSTNSTDTFGNLQQYLESDGATVFFFDNCVEDPNDTIEGIAGHLATFLTKITYDNGDQVPQIDLVAFSMGGLIARAYLAGLQTDGTALPPATTFVRDLVLIATPNFGSFVAGNYITVLAADELGVQSAELIPGSSFLWNLATWNQRGDDLRGVNALAIVGNAGPYVASLSSTTETTYASDGLVSETSAALGFALPDATPTQVVPYCHVDPSVFTNTAILGTFNCDAAGIANVTDDTQETGVIVRSFLAGSSAWESTGVTAAKDPILSTYGGIFFAAETQRDAYVTDMTAASWGTVELNNGGDNDVVFYTDLVDGTGVFAATSSSLGSIFCGETLTEPAGYFSAARCKTDTVIFSVGPLSSAPGRIVNSGGAITITGFDFGGPGQCGSCQVLASPANSTAATALQVSSWTDTIISATLPASLTGLLTIEVVATTGTDAITIMAAAPGPALAATPTSLQFAYTAGGAVPAAQSIQITNSGSGTLTWTASASQPWLTLSAASGTAPSTLSASVAPASLKAGTYTDTIAITASGASGSPLSIAVTLTVTASTSTLGVMPAALNFNYTVGGTAPAAQNVTITTGGAGAAGWTASSSVFWASVSPASSSASGTLSVTINPANLAAGSYSGNVQITAAAGGTASVSITLVVTGTQPAGTITAVTNGGSFAAGFASATWVSIFGTNLSASTSNWNASSFANGLLPTSVDGLSVTINGIPAYVDFISPTQINVLAPDDPATGTVQIQVTAAGQKSNSFAAQKQPFAPGFFTFDNGKYVAAQHSDYSLLGASGLIAGATTTPAMPGETILMYGTGFGPTSPTVPTADLVSTSEPLANTVTMTIGGKTATVIFAGLVESGLYQFNVTVPGGLPSGDAPVVATIGGVSTQAGVSITIQ